MDKLQFRVLRTEGRSELLGKIIKVFKDLDPVSIHQFGSGASGYKDEFSDIDIWITLNDSDIKRIVPRLPGIFKQIAPVILRHHSRSWSPPQGSSNSVIHKTDKGLFIVDYYVSALSQTYLKEDSKLIYGKDKPKKGEWILNKDINSKIHDNHSVRKDINLLLSLIYISIKIIVRDPGNEDFLHTLKFVHQGFRKRYQGLIRRRIIKLSFRSDRRLLNDLYRISNKPQRKAINLIKRYMKEVEELYL